MAVCLNYLMSDGNEVGVARRLHVARQGLMRNIKEAAEYLRAQHGYSLETFAELTKLHRNSMLKLREEEWQPATDTLEKLEIILLEAADRRAGRPGRVEPPTRGRPVKTAAEASDATEQGAVSRTGDHPPTGPEVRAS